MNYLYWFVSFSLVIGCLGSCLIKRGNARNYYFDPVSGNDSQSGRNPGNAFRSLSKIATLDIKPGDSILLKGGARFGEVLEITCRGDSSKPIVIGKYGSGERPIIALDGSREAAVHVLNSEFLVVRDLEIVNNAGKPVPGINGLWIELRNFGTAHNIHIDNLFVHDVTGSCTREEKDGGHGIFIQNYRDKSPDTIFSNFDNLLIENCLIKDCNRSGIILWGNWIRSKWKPSTNVVIRNNVLDGVPGDGIVPVGCDGVLVEYNVMRNCPCTLPVTEAADGIWPWSCDNAVVQFNMVSDHKSQVDGYGFDSDWNSNNSLFQYNISYNNDGGFLLVCNSGGWPASWSIGNRGTVVRYNLSINDGLRDFKLKEKYFSPIIHCTGPIANSLIEKNLIYLFLKPHQEIDKTLISFTDWEGYPDSTFFRKNFIFTEEHYKAVDISKATHTFFADNIFFGDLKAPEGFRRMNHNGLGFDENDLNWKKLMDFARDKKLQINGREVFINDLLKKQYGMEN